MMLASFLLLPVLTATSGLFNNEPDPGRLHVEIIIKILTF